MHGVCAILAIQLLVLVGIRPSDGGRLCYRSGIDDSSLPKAERECTHPFDEDSATLVNCTIGTQLCYVAFQASEGQGTNAMGSVLYFL